MYIYRVLHFALHSMRSVVMSCKHVRFSFKSRFSSDIASHQRGTAQDHHQYSEAERQTKHAALFGEGQSLSFPISVYFNP